MTHMFEKHFTLDQANAMIPHVRRLFAEVRTLLAPPGSSGAPDHYLPPDSTAHTSNGNGISNGSASSNGSSNGHGLNASHSASQPAFSTPFDMPGLSPGETAAASDYSQWSEEKRHEAAYRLLNALQSQGIVIQDVERGLIDFPSILNEREVFLCYELTDGHSIQYYHDIDAGYAGRKKITETD